MRIINIGWFGFWILLATAIACATYCYKITPNNPLRELMTSTKEERLIRNLQDPLAMRLYAMSKVLEEMSSQGTTDLQKAMIDAVVKQWAEEVGALKAAAYHSKAAESQWDASKLSLNQEQKEALIDVTKGFDVNVMGGK